MSDQIPAIIHRVWIGGDRPSPTEQACYESVLAMHPNWQHWVCGDDYRDDFDDKRDDYVPESYLFGQPALKALGINYECFLDRCLTAYRGTADRRAIASDFLRVCMLYAFGGFYLDWDMYCLQPLDDMRGEDVVFAQIRESRIAEAVIGCRPNDPRLRDILVRYVETQQPESGTCCLNLTGFTDERGIRTFPPEYFVPHMRNEEGEALYRHTANTRFVHCWRQRSYDVGRLATMGAVLRGRTYRHPIPRPVGRSGCYRNGVKVDC